MATVLITGTSTGIGLATAQHFARAGFTVFAGARTPEASEGLTQAVAAGLPLTPVVLDVNRDDSVGDALARIGHVDILVNNAGIGSAGAVEHMPLDEVRALFETNFYGAVRLMQAVLPSMRARRHGVIVNVTSAMGRMTLPCHGFYAATKFALGAVSESLAMEVRPFGIRVAVIEPGVVLTPIWGKRPQAMPPDHAYRTPLSRLSLMFGSQMDGGTTPDTVAAAIVDAATRPDVPLHIPVGADAEVWTAGRDAVSPDEWVSLMAEPDTAVFRARAERVFGVDTFSPPSLNARRARNAGLPTQS